MPRPLPADTWNNLFYPPPDYGYFVGAGHQDFEPAAAGYALLAYVKDWNAVTAALRRAQFDEMRPIGTLTAIAHPAEYFSSALRNKAPGDPPPYIVGNHTPARYAIRLWNKYTGL